MRQVLSKKWRLPDAELLLNMADTPVVRAEGSGRASARTGDSHQHQPGKAPPSRVERLLPGQSAEPASGMMISLGDIYYDTVYVNRSFAVENHSSMPLDFVLSHDKQRDAATEINFSLSNTALKVFSTLLVPPHSSRRVFLHFRTSLPRASPAAAPSNGGAAAVAAAPAANGGGGALEPPSPQRGADTHFAHVLHGGRGSVAGLLGPAHMQIEISVSEP